MQEYFEGTRIISNDDGSTTYITYEHEPYSEPMTKKQLIATMAATFGVILAPIGFVAAAAGLEKWTNRRDENKTKRSRQKLNKEIFDSMKKS